MKTFALSDAYRQTQARAQVALICLLALLLGLAVGLNYWLTTRAEAARLLSVDDEPLYATDAGIRGASLAFSSLAADVYWMRALQYIGKKTLLFRANNPGQQLSLDDLTPLNPRQLYPLLDRATTLDPQFIAAYEYGGVVLPAINGDDAIRLLKKGIGNNPEVWRLYHHLGYLYWQRKEYQAASQAYNDASRLPSAPNWLPAMSALLQAEGGSYDTARAMYRQMAATTDDPNIKQMAELRLLQVNSLEEREALRKVIQDFRAHLGRCPAHWQELNAQLRAARLSHKEPLYFNAQGAPLDPADTPYLLVADGCDVDLDSRSRVPYR